MEIGSTGQGSTGRRARYGTRARRLLGFGASAAVLACGLAFGGPRAEASPAVYHVWCGDWDANPANATTLGSISTVPLKDGAVAEIEWGAYDGHEYAWAQLVDAPVGDHIALYWVDNQNNATYQCGDSHGYNDATVWQGTHETWTAGVPLTAPRAGDAVASAEGYFVWNGSGNQEYQSPKFTIKPTRIPPPPSPPPPPAPSPSPPPTSHKPPVVRLLLHRSPASLVNGQTVRLFGRLRGLPSPAGVIVQLQALVTRPKRHWMTFGIATASSDGRFSYTYRFTRTTRIQVYRLRARIPSQLGFPYRAAASRPEPVRVTG
jgi:hypothetical protein